MINIFKVQYGIESNQNLNKTAGEKKAVKGNKMLVFLIFVNG